MIQACTRLSKLAHSKELIYLNKKHMRISESNARLIYGEGRTVVRKSGRLLRPILLFQRGLRCELSSGPPATSRDF